MIENEKIPWPQIEFPMVYLGGQFPLKHQFQSKKRDVAQFPPVTVIVFRFRDGQRPQLSGLRITGRPGAGMMPDRSYMVGKTFGFLFHVNLRYDPLPYSRPAGFQTGFS